MKLMFSSPLLRRTGARCQPARASSGVLCPARAPRVNQTPFKCSATANGSIILLSLLLSLNAAWIDAILRQNVRHREVCMALAQYADGGFFAPGKIAEALRTTSEEVARTAGLGRDAVQRKERVRSDKTQRRLREMVEILNKVEPRFGSALMAYAWYRSEPLSGFSGQTAMQLVRGGRAAEVLDYIDAVDAGVHA
jgi:hypothetical protein